MQPALHSDLASLAFLVGTWRGTGRGVYPTIDPFSYEEEVVIGHVGKPFLDYRQRTWSIEGKPLHAEAGYFRMADGAAELVVAQPTGFVEVHEGTVDGASVALMAQSVGRTPSAKSVVAVTRLLWVDDDVLHYRLQMAAVGQELQIHLEAELRRVPADSPPLQSPP